MPIQVVCPNCDKTYKVKDEAAGKKLRCKTCETVIPIPAADVAEPDPWDVLPEEGNENELPPSELPPVQRKKRPQGQAKRTRAGSGGGMPVTVIVSIVLCGVMIALNILAAIASLLGADVTNGVGGVIRLAVNATIIKGLVDRSNRLRWNAIFLDGIGLAWAFLCGGAIVFFADGPKLDNMPGGKTGFVVILAFQIVLWIVDLTMLVSPSARDYCNQ